MKANIHFLLTVCLLWLAAACSKDEAVEPSITLPGSTTELTLAAEQNAKLSIDFTSTYPWEATANVDWVVVSPNKGEAGNARINILSLEENRTGEPREGSLTIVSNGISKSVSFTQDFQDVINLKQNSYEVPAAGQTLDIGFETNCTDYSVEIETEGDIDWVIQATNDRTRSLQANSVSLIVLPNEVLKERSAVIRLKLANSANPEEILLTSEPITINQEAAAVGVSTDFSANKQVTVLQSHTEGNGIPVVIMGDGFLDKDVTEGYYREVMEQAMENFFTEEPIRSLRAYFDVWMVNAISLNNSFEEGYSTVFNSWLEGNGSTLITGNNEKVMEYVLAVPELANNPGLYEEALSIVVLNTTEYAGTCHYRFSNNAGQIINFAVCYCPTINNVTDDMFRRVLCHEAAGHGFAKLMDEYSYQESGAITQSAITSYRQMQQMGWAANVDFTPSRNDVLWNRFLTDARYQGADAYGELLGVYEGACTYWSGAYRPTNDSMMRNNQHGFNAPSREAIFKRIMSLAYGEAWTYDYEEFVAFDLAHLPQPVDAQTKAPAEATRHFATPVQANRPLVYIH